MDGGRRQIFLTKRTQPVLQVQRGVTVALLMLMVVCAKQRIDHRRVLWVTAEMMTDLYNHDLYSRDVAEKAIEKYNQHIERCNRAIEAESAPTQPCPELKQRRRHGGDEAGAGS